MTADVKLTVSHGVGGEADRCTVGISRQPKAARFCDGKEMKWDHHAK